MTSVPTTVLVLGDSDLGPRVANWIAAAAPAGVEVRLAVRGDIAAPDLANLEHGVEFLGGLTRAQSESLAANVADPNNFLVTCYWPWILPESSFAGYEGATLNFHPALLPRDRGWYPHVHQIRFNQPSGVTLHQLDAEADTGMIWAQREVPLPFPLTGGQARERLREAIFTLFTDHWDDVVHRNIRPTPQQGPSSYHTKADVAALDSVDREAWMTFEDAIRAIACRNAGRRSFLQLQGDEGPIFVHLSFSTDGRVPRQ